jgi:hypothetical protein
MMEKQSRGRLEFQRIEALEVLAGWQEEAGRQAEAGGVRPETAAALENARAVLAGVEAELAALGEG